MSRRDSAAMVSKTRELFPEPETPVNTVSRRLGISTSTSLRLFSRAPRTRMTSCASVSCAVLTACSVVVPIGLIPRLGSGDLLKTDGVARRVTEGAVAHAPVLVGGLLHDLDVVALDPGEGGVDVGGGEHDAGVGALGHHLGDGALLVLGDAGVGGGRVEDDRGPRLALRAHRDPAHRPLTDVLADLEAHRVAVERERGLRVGVRKEAGVNGDVHGRHASSGSRDAASLFLIGRVTVLATQGGTPVAERSASRW